MDKIWWKKYVHLWQRPFIKDVYFENREENFLGEKVKHEYLMIEFKNGYKEESPMFLEYEGTTNPAIAERISQAFLHVDWLRLTAKRTKQEIQDYEKYSMK